MRRKDRKWRNTPLAVFLRLRGKYGVILFYMCTQSLVLILFGHRHHKSQISTRKLLQSNTVTLTDTLSEFKNIDSKILLARTVDLIAEKGWRVGNIDATVCAERPKLKARIPEMQEVLAHVMGVEADDVSIKATTTEKLGFTGREEGISAYATVLIEKD